MFVVVMDTYVPLIREELSLLEGTAFSDLAEAFDTAWPAQLGIDLCVNRQSSLMKTGRWLFVWWTPRWSQ
jgi:hypothetical protein